MAAVTVLRRATNKAHPTSVLEADTILVGGVELSAAGTGNLYADANVTDINIGTGATATIDVGSTTGGAVTLNSGGTIAIGDGTAGAVSLDSGAGVSLDAAAASNFTTSAGALTLTSAAAATWSTAAGGLILDGAGGVQLQGNAGEIDLTTSGALDLNAGAYTLDCSTAVITPTSTYDLEATGAIGIDSSAAINIGDTNATAVQVGRAGISVTIPGDLVVQGTTTSVDNENMQTQDNHIYLNKDYTTVSGQTGGLALNYLPTATADTEAAGGFTAATTVATTGASGLATGGGAFVQVSGAANPANDGIYEVATHTGNVLTINATPTHRFCNTGFTVDATGSTAAFTVVNISVIQSNTTGDWELGKADDATALSSSLSTIGAGAGNSLNAAYLVGNTISMTDAAGDFDVSVGSGTPAISLDAAGASNFSVASGNLTLETTTSGVLLLAAAGLMDVNAAAGLDIDVTGAYDMLATGAFSIDGTGTSNVTADTGDLTVSTTTSGSLILDGVALVDINAGANLDVDVTGTVDILSTGAFSIDGTGASNLTTATGDLTVAATAGSAILSGGEAAADAVQITAGNAAGGVDINAGTGGITADSDAGISLDAATASNFSVTTGALTLETITSGDLTLQTTTAGDILLSGAAEIDLTAATLVDINGASLEADLTGAFSIDGATASNITVSGATADLTLGARAGTITLNESGDTTLDGGFAATSIIGALNELLTGAGTENALQRTLITTGRAVGEPVVMDGDLSANTATDASAIATAEGFIGIVTVAAASGTVVTSGTANVQIIAGLTGGTYPTAGDPVYLSTTTGRATTDVSAFSPPNDVIYQIGIATDASAVTVTTSADGDLLEIELRPFVPVEL